MSGTHTPADLRRTTVRDVYDNDRSSPPMHNMSGATRSFHCGSTAGLQETFNNRSQPCRSKTNPASSLPRPRERLEAAY